MMGSVKKDEEASGEIHISNQMPPHSDEAASDESIGVEDAKISLTESTVTEDSMISPTDVPNVDIVLGSSSSPTLEDHEEESPGPLRVVVSGSRKISVTDKKSRGQQQPQHQQRPGVILLGRGNSFSLGRSEVIVLHNRKQARTRKSNASDVSAASRTSSNCDSLSSSSSSGGRTTESCNSNNNKNSQESPTPPPISNGESEDMIIGPGLQETGAGDDALCSFEEDDGDDLDTLWRKAESVMFAKLGAVQKVLEDFGVGEAGGGGGGGDEDELVTEEENVWQVVQENFQV